MRFLKDSIRVTTQITLRLVRPDSKHRITNVLRLNKTAVRTDLNFMRAKNF